MVIDKIREAFNNLKSQNRFFVSEADFQHCLAMELERAFHDAPDTSIILEFPIEQGGRKIYVDIMIVHDGRLYPIELKYKTKHIPADSLYGKTQIPMRNILKDQAAQDLGGYEIWKDVNRIERLIKNDQAHSGVCIVISNDKYYWDGFCSPRAQGFAFRTKAGLYAPRKCDWNITKQTDVKKWIAEHPGFRIENEYNLEWADFHNCEHQNGCFKSLFIPIPPKKPRPKSRAATRQALADIEHLRERTKGYISEEYLEKLVSLGINPLNSDGTLKSRNTLSVMVWRYTDKSRWAKAPQSIK